MLPHQRPYGSWKKSCQAKPSLLLNHTPSFPRLPPFLWRNPALADELKHLLAVRAKLGNTNLRRTRFPPTRCSSSTILWLTCKRRSRRSRKTCANCSRSETSVVYSHTVRTVLAESDFVHALVDRSFNLAS
jgi:hypothetical protein